MIFPWQVEQWQQLWQAKCDQRLPHALLFSGLAGTGKAQFADNFARALLCSTQSADNHYACGTCHSCRLMAGRAHQNVLWIEPEKDGHTIKIDQVRSVSEYINQTSLQGNLRIVIINPANYMNTNSANALLKTLEEPSSGAVIILVSDQPAQLPATILSRCQRMVFPRPRPEQALTWLKQQLTIPDTNHELLLRVAQGAPLAALQLVKNEILTMRQDLFTALYALAQQQADPIKSAATIQDNDPLRLLDFMLVWIMDLLRLQLSGDEEMITNRDYLSQLSELKQSTELNANTKFMQYLQQIRGQVSVGVNFNKQLLLENILIRWMGCTQLSVGV
jgi:DNA polymerase-3 subunit delta'